MAEPRLVAVEEDYLVAAKPAGMHTAPLRPDESGTLLAWLGERHPEVLTVRGRKSIEGGLLHRLDRETSGLVLAARSQAAFDRLARLSAAGGILKRYRAGCGRSFSPAPGRKILLAPLGWDIEAWKEFLSRPSERAFASPVTIRSAFRAFGKGRRLVSAVAESGAGAVYETRLCWLKPTAAAGPEPAFDVIVELSRGFRHQVRCHLASAGLPIIGDLLYGPPGDIVPADGLRLHAEGLDFTDPRTGEARSYLLPAE